MRVVVVGAGLAGVACARRLESVGHEVIVVDKGRSVGGRMATRRIGDATFDTGAQFFTVRSDAFAAEVDAWTKAGVATVWHHGLTGNADGFPRYRGIPSMNAVVKQLAAPLNDVRCGVTVRHVEPGRVELDDGSPLSADVVVITSPVRQSATLLQRSGLELPAWVNEVTYWPTMALLAVLDGPSALSAPGAVQDADEWFQIVVDNAVKGVSAVPALTLHLRNEISEQRWDDDPDVVFGELLAAAQPWCGTSKVVASELKRWRYATPKTVWPEPCLALADGRIVLAGDAFCGPRVEAAVLSGWAAAERCG